MCPFYIGSTWLLCHKAYIAIPNANINFNNSLSYILRKLLKLFNEIIGAGAELVGSTPEWRDEYVR